MLHANNYLNFSCLNMKKINKYRKFELVFHLFVWNWGQSYGITNVRKKNTRELVQSVI